MKRSSFSGTKSFDLSQRNFANFRVIDFDDHLCIPNWILRWRRCFIFVLAVIVYWNTLDGTFVFDDTEAVVNNPDSKSTSSSLFNVFLNDFWGTKLSSPNSHKSYRPITVLSYRLNHALAGGTFDARAFHGVNVAIYGAVCVLFDAALTSLFTQGCRVAFLAAVLFAVHPVHTEAVAAIVGRADLLCALLYLASILSYVRYSQNCAQRRQSGVIWGWSLFIASIVFAALSMLAKETGITVFAVLIAYDLLVVCNTQFPKLLCSPSVFLSHLSRHIVLICTALLLFAARWRLMDGKTPTFQPIDNPASFDPSIFNRILNYNYLYSLNALIVLWPQWLCFDWSMGCVPLLQSFTDPRGGAVFVFWSVVLTLSVVCAVRSGYHNRMALFAIAVAVLSFIPASNLFFRVGFVIAERVLFIPSMGFCLLVAVGAARLAKVFPSKVHYNIAKSTNQRSLAIAEYLEALRLYPEYDQAMNNLANIYKDEGQLYEAEMLLQRALEIRPTFAAAWMNLGIVQAALKKTVESEKSYRMAIQHRNNYPDCYFNLGNLYLQIEQHDEALRCWRNATRLKPTHVLSWNNMIILLDSRNELEAAESVGEEALKVVHGEASLHFNVANTFGKRAKFRESEYHFKRAIELRPRHASYYANLGVLYHRWQHYDDAEKYYKLALDINPSLNTAKDNLAMLRRQRGIK